MRRISVVGMRMYWGVSTVGAGVFGEVVISVAVVRVEDSLKFGYFKTCIMGGHSAWHASAPPLQCFHFANRTQCKFAGI